MSVKEIPVTSAFEDDADQVECALEISVLIPPIARTFPNHLVPVDGDTGLCCVIWPTRNRLSPTLPNITSFNIGVYCLPYTEFAVTWEIVKLQIVVWLFAPLTSHRQMGNSKCVNT